LSNWKRLTLILVAILLVAAPASTVWAAGYSLAGVGAKALSMSGSFRAIADDWSAMYWNPAGLAGQQSSFFVEAKLLYPVTWVTPNTTYPDGFYRNGVEQSVLAKAFPSGAMAYVQQINEKMTFGVSVFAPSAAGTTWENLVTDPPYGYNNNVPFPKEDWSSDIKIIDIHPTIGYQLTEKLKVGAGFGIMYGMIQLQSPALIASGAPMPYEYLYALTNLEGTGLGYGFNIGAIYDVTEKLHVGFMYKGDVELDIDGSVAQTVYCPVNAGMAASNPLIFSGGTLEAEPDAKAKFPLPGEWGFDVAYDVNDRLTVAGGFTFVHWSFADEVTIEMDGLSPTGAPAEDALVTMHYEDIMRFNFGMNYVVNADKGFEIRAGYYNDPTAIPNENIHPYITDAADKHNVSFGFAHNLTESLLIEGYWEHVFTPTRTAIDGEHNTGGDWKMQVDTFGIQFAYRF